MVDNIPVEGDRGILTEKDRKYLVGEIDIDEYENPQKQENTFRYRIRNRVERALKDFILIEKFLSKEDWNNILEDSKNAVDDLKEEASRTGTAPDPQEHNYPDVSKGLDSAIKGILKAHAEVHGRSYTMAFIRDNLKEIIQMQNVVGNDEFYYGDIELEMADFEENSIDLGLAFGCLEDIIEQKNKAGNEKEFLKILSAALDEFVGELPNMPTYDYILLIDAFHITGRLPDSEYEIIRQVMVDMVMDVRLPAIDEEIDDWHIPLDLG